MDLNEYQQSLIKCQYMTTVCDQLLNQLETKALAKIFQRNKLISGEDGHKEFKKYDRIQAEFMELSDKINKNYQQKAKHLDTQIKQQNQQIKKLKIQISLLKQSRHEGTRDTRLNIRKIKQVSQLQTQSVQLRKLLNIQLQNLNSLEVSNIEMNETILKFQKKQIDIKLKIKKVMEKENQYLRCKDMEENYEALFVAKRKLVEQNALYDSQKHTQVFNKISTIAQSNQNLDEMNRYENQLGKMIKEKIFIIEEIQKREELYKKDHVKEIDSQDDTQIFKEQINNLRKTIANRKFQQRSKSINPSNNLDAFLNNSTPKNSIHYTQKEDSKKPKYESIFKIEIEPVSHLKKSNKVEKDDKELQRGHRNSLPNQISKKPRNKSPQKPFPLHKEYLSENKLPDLDTIEIAALQKIIKNKESRMKQALERTPIPSQFNGIPINEYKSSQVSSMVRNNQHNKKLMITEPVEPRYKSSQPTLSRKQINGSRLPPNSRFIEQIIESNSGEYIDRLKSNVRFRTKKSESQKYRHIQAIQQQKRKFLQQKMKDSEQNQSSKIASSKTVQPAIDHFKNMDHLKSITPKTISSQQSNIKKNDLSFASMYENDNDNEFMGIDIKPNLSEQKQYKLKYKDRINSFSYHKSSVDNVLERIDLLKKVQLQKNQAYEAKQGDKGKTAGEKKQKTDKVKIFKLSSLRKYGNGTAFSRKGKAEGMEDFESDQESILPKIQEEDESIRNTLQSIAHIEEKR